MKKLLIFMFMLSLIFNACSSKKDLADRIPPKYKGFYNLTKYVLTPEEFDVFLALNDSEKEDYIIKFWEKSNPFPNTLTNEFRDLLISRTREADEKFSFGKTMGSDTHRGKVYIIYGPPDEIDQRDYDQEYDRDLRHYGQSRETDADIAGDYRKQKNYEYWIYENTFGLKPNTTITFVDDYSSGQYKMLTNILTFQDRNIPNPLRLYLTEEGKALFQQRDASDIPSLIHMIDDKKPLLVNTDYIAFPKKGNTFAAVALVYIPLKNLVFIENDIRQSVAIVEIEAEFSGKNSVYNKKFSEEIIISQNILQRYISSGSYLLSIVFDISPGFYSLDIRVTDVRTKSSGQSSLEISPLEQLSIEDINLISSTVLLSAEDEVRVFTSMSMNNILHLGQKQFKPVYGNVYSKTKALNIYQEMLIISDSIKESYEIEIALYSKETGRLISKNVHEIRTSDNKLTVDLPVDVSRIGTGHYELQIILMGHNAGKKEFYFLR